MGLVLRWLRDADVPERDRLAALLTIYTVQRRSAVVQARIDEFSDVDGVACWVIPPLHRKTAMMRLRHGTEAGSHVIPLTRQTREIVEKARALAGDSEWMFPATKARRVGSAVTHMPPEAITHLLGDVPGRPASPHDVRRAFATTYARAARITLSQKKLILDHAEDIPAGDVTAGHYAFDPRIEEKLPIVTGWADWLDAQAL